LKILVTGSAGFIGYHLCNSLLNDGYDVLGIDNINDYYNKNLKLERLQILKKYNNFNFKKIDISNRRHVAKIFKNFKPNKVINLAAQAGVRFSIENPYSYINSNIVGFINLIEISKQNNVDGFIYASSSSVYGGNKKLPFSERDMTNDPISLYGASKKSNELIANSYSSLYGLNTTGLRYFTVYGPWGRPDMAYFTFTKKILAEEPIEVYNDGKMKRDFTFIDDIINGTKSAIEKNHKCEIFNLGNNKNEELMDLIKVIEDELSIEAIIDFLPMQSGDVIETYANIDKSIEKLNYNPKISINDGIPKFINWYKKYYH
jgi:UDP-glucuronate 4-epimerase